METYATVVKQKNFILFGCGKIGKKVFELFGKDKVAFFADNKIGGKRSEKNNGVDIIPFSTYIEVQKNYITIITTGKKSESEIADQLIKSGIKHFVLWEEVVGIFNYDKKAESIEMRAREGIEDDRWLKVVLPYIEESLNLKQDETSEVEFYFVSAFEISHFLPLYTALRQNGIKARIVVEPPAINSVGEWLVFQQVSERLSCLGVEYSTLRNSNAKVAFTTQYARYLKYYNRTVKCQVPYGIPMRKDKMFRWKKEVAEVFDYIFVHGDMDKEMGSRYLPVKHVIDISYPRYLEPLERKVEKGRILKEFGIVTDKPIIVYFPTWDMYSSVLEYEDSIKKLREKFYVISKSHHNSWRNSGNMEALYRMSDLVLDGNGNYDLLNLAYIADCAICDAESGVATEVVFLKPDIHLILICKDYLRENFYIDLNEYAEWIEKPSDMKTTIEKVLLKDEKIEYRKNIINRLYSPDIHAGIERMVGQIQKILEK